MLVARLQPKQDEVFVRMSLSFCASGLLHCLCAKHLLQVLKEVMGSDVLWYMEGHSVACVNQFRESLGILTTQFGFGVPDYEAQSELDGAHRNDER